MRYVLNRAVISRPVQLRVQAAHGLEAEVWLKQDRFVSRVGSREAAQLVQDRFGRHCPLSRE